MKFEKAYETVVSEVCSYLFVPSDKLDSKRPKSSLVLWKKIYYSNHTVTVEV